MRVRIPVRKLLAALRRVTGRGEGPGLLCEEQSRSGQPGASDSSIYASCVLNAAASPFQFQRHGCAGHTSHAYVLMLTLPARLGLGGMAGILLVNLLLGMGAIVSIYAIARSVFPGSRSQLDCAWVAATWAVHPALAATAVFVNVDYGVTVFGLATLALVLRGRFAVASLTGLLLVFSKETGVALLAVLLFSWLVFSGGSRRHGAREFVTALLALTSPLLLFGTYWWFLRPPRALLWGGSSLLLFREALRLPLLAPASLNALAAVFVLNFGWLMTAFVVGDLLRRTTKWAFGRHFHPPKPTPPKPAEAAKLRLVASVTWLTVLALTRLPTSVIPRYFGIIYPLLLLAFAAAARCLLPQRLARRCLAAGFAAVLWLSTFRTVDPISRRLYGTFRFGDHSMLAMTSIGHECCGYGIDQLVYNLEFVRLHEALGDALVEFRPSPDDPLVIADGMGWYLLGWADEKTCRPSLGGAGSVRVPYTDLTGLAARVEPPRQLTFLALPTVDNRDSLEQLSRRYHQIQALLVGSGGYWMRAYRMQRR